MDKKSVLYQLTDMRMNGIMNCRRRNEHYLEKISGVH